MRTRTLLVIGLLLGGSTAHAKAFIGLFSTPDCSGSSLEIPASVGSGTFYVSVVGAADDPWMCTGIYGVEFRVDGLPAGWLYTVTPNPLANTLLGNPMGAGANIAFPRSQSGNCILLYAVTLTPVPSGSEATLRVLRHTIPSNPEWACPRILPDCFESWGICVEGGTLLVNSTVGVVRPSWGGVKRLYH